VRTNSNRAWWEILFWIVVVLTVASSFTNWLTGTKRPSVQEGQPCGPGYVWTSTGGVDPDLSCERER
jgi:hypothetical protein